MDFKVSRKEQRFQPRGPVMELVDDVFDLYIITDAPGGHVTNGRVIYDIEILNDAAEEQLDRAMFAIVKQRGLDPIEPTSGIQWAENILGEVPSAIVLRQIQDAVQAEGPGVQIVPASMGEGTSFTISLTNPRNPSIV